MDWHGIAYDGSHGTHTSLTGDRHLINPDAPGWAGPDGGLYRGADAVNRWYANYFAQWADQHWELEETLEYGPNVAFVMYWIGKGRRSGVALGSRFLMVMTFAEGKLVTIVHLGGSQELLEG